MKLIMVVEDDPDFRYVMELALEGAGYRVMSAGNAGEALQAMAEATPDLVITDLMMGELLSGVSLFEKMQEDSRLKDVPVVVVSGIVGERGLKFSPGLPDQLDAAGVRAYLEKPVDPEEVVHKVNELLS